jgi:hypothetical protein
VADEAALVARGQGSPPTKRSVAHAQLLGDGPLDLGPRPHRQLHAASPDVQDQRAAALEVDAVQGGEIDEPGLLFARHHLGVEPDLARDPLEEVLPVGRLAHGGGGRDQELVDAVHVGQPLVLPQGVETAPHGGSGEPPREGVRSPRRTISFSRSMTWNPPERLSTMTMWGSCYRGRWRRSSSGGM